MKERRDNAYHSDHTFVSRYRASVDVLIGLYEGQHGKSGWAHWAARCPEFWNEDECVEAKDGFAQQRRGWTAADTEHRTPTNTLIAPNWARPRPLQPPGAVLATMCIPRRCATSSTTAMSSCHWNSGEYADCEWDESTTDTPQPVLTTTGTPPPPGCCYGNPEGVYSLRWEETADDYDCSQLWPSRSPTPPPVPEGPGCCKAEAEMHVDKCDAIEGCCAGDSRSLYRGSNDICKEFYNEDDCQRPQSDDGYSRSIFRNLILFSSFPHSLHLDY